MTQIKLFFKENFKKILLFLLTIFLLFEIIFSFFSGQDYLIAFNRNSNSGARGSFENSLGKKKDEKYTKNVLEVDSTDSMIKKIINKKNSIGYSSIEAIEGDYKEDLYLIDVDDKGVEDDQYPFKISFNVFFRVKSDFSEEIYDNLWINSHSYNIKNESNVWDENNDSKYSNLDKNLLGSFAFLNWLLYSETSQKTILPNGKNKDLEVKLKSKDLKNYFKNLSFQNSKFKIITIGSTSVLNQVTSLFYSSETDIEGFLNKGINGFILETKEVSGNECELIFANDGSGSAFSLNQNYKKSYLGFQSRNLKKEEIKNFNYNDFVVEESGVYESVDIPKEKFAPYFTFSFDSLAFITSKKTLLDNKRIANIDLEGIRQIYLHNKDWNYLLENGLIKLK